MSSLITLTPTPTRTTAPLSHSPFSAYYITYSHRPKQTISSSSRPHPFHLSLLHAPIPISVPEPALLKYPKPKLFKSNVSPLLALLLFGTSQDPSVPCTTVTAAAAAAAAAARGHSSRLHRLSTYLCVCVSYTFLHSLRPAKNGRRGPYALPGSRVNEFTQHDEIQGSRTGIFSGEGYTVDHHQHHHHHHLDRHTHRHTEEKCVNQERFQSKFLHSAGSFFGYHTVRYAKLPHLPTYLRP